MKTAEVPLGVASELRLAAESCTTTPCTPCEGKSVAAELRFAAESCTTTPYTPCEVKVTSASEEQLLSSDELSGSMQFQAKGLGREKLLGSEELSAHNQGVPSTSVQSMSWCVHTQLSANDYAGFPASLDASHIIDVAGVASKRLPSQSDRWSDTSPVLGRNSFRMLSSMTSASIVAQKSSASLLRSVNRFLSIRQPEITSSRSSGVEVLHFVSFGDRRDLLRASPLSTILAGCAKILGSNGGDAKTYALSMPVKHIDVFISHNWVTSRLDKCLSLSLHFNFWRAACISLVVQLIALCLTIEDVFPVAYVYWSIYPTGVCCRLLGIPVFLLGLVLSGDIWRWFGWKGPAAFLDKTCIHQSDKTVQKMGIGKLGAFLCNSKKMVVLYTDVYMTKLWTVYEFACFCSLHPVSDIQLLPVFLTRTTYMGLAMIYLCVTVSVVMEYWGWFYNILEVSLVLGTPLLTYVFRLEAKGRLAMKRRFQDFTVDGCSCSNEEDRPLVYGNIADLMRAAEVVQWSTSQEAALSQFNVLVRKKLPKLVDTAMGRGRRYGEAAVLCVPAVGPALLDSLVGAVDMAWSEALSDLVTRCTFMFMVMPLAIAWSQHLVGYCIHLRPCLEALLVLSVAWLVGALYCSVCNTAMTVLWANSTFPENGTLDLPFWLNMGVVAFNICATCWTFASKPGSSWSLLKCRAMKKLQQEWLVEKRLSEEEREDMEKRLSVLSDEADQRRVGQHLSEVSEEDREQMEKRLSVLSDEAEKRRGSGDLSTLPPCSEDEVCDPSLEEQMKPERPCEHHALKEYVQHLAVGRTMAPIVKCSSSHLTGYQEEVNGHVALSAACCNLQQCRS